MQHWYAVCVKGRMERAVGKQLAEKGFETYVPLSVNNRRNAGKPTVTQSPLFPGYVLCRMDPLIRLQALVTPGVMHIVGDRTGPAPIPDVEIESVRRMVESENPCEVWPFVQVGQVAEITSGSLAGLTGIVVRVKNAARIVISVSLLQRSVAMEVNAADLRVLQASEFAACPPDRILGVQHHHDAAAPNQRTEAA